MYRCLLLQNKLPQNCGSQHWEQLSWWFWFSVSWYWVKIADGIQLSEGPSGIGGSTSKVARWLTTKLARQLILGAKSQSLSLWISPQHCLSFSQHGGWIPPERDPVDQGKSRNGIHDLVSAITLSPAWCYWSQTPALSRHGRREDMSMNTRR